MNNVISFPAGVQTFDDRNRQIPRERLEEFDRIGTVGDFTVILAHEAGDEESLVHVAMIGPTPADIEVIETTAGDDLGHSIAEMVGNAAVKALWLGHAPYRHVPEAC